VSTNVTIKDAAKNLNVSEQRVRTLCSEGLISAEKFGTSWLIESESLSRYGITAGYTIAEDHPVYMQKITNL